MLNIFTANLIIQRIDEKSIVLKYASPICLDILSLNPFDRFTFFTDKDQKNNNEASHLVSIHLILYSEE